MQKGSVQASGSESDSEADTESQAGGNSGSKEGEDSGGKDEGSGSEDEGSGGEGEGSSGEGEPGDGNSQQGDSSGEVVEVSRHEAEKSRSESSSSSSESEVEAKKARPSRKTAETDPNTTLSEFDSKDSEEEQKISHHMDADFGTWRDKKISQGLKQWDERDKMTCDDTEPGKEVKCSDPLGALLDYMESHGVFESIEMSDYNMCCFYKVGLSGDFPEFPTPCEPATTDHMHGFLEKSEEFLQPNLLVVHSQDMVTVVCLL